MATETIETKRELEETPAEEPRYKYVLNGKTFYYTREELKDYFVILFEKNYLPLSDNILEVHLNKVLKTISKYDGDPHGYLPKTLREISHQGEVQGKLFLDYSIIP